MLIVKVHTLPIWKIYPYICVSYDFGVAFIFLFLQSKRASKQAKEIPFKHNSILNVCIDILSFVIIIYCCCLVYFYKNVCVTLAQSYYKTYSHIIHIDVLAVPLPITHVSNSIVCFYIYIFFKLFVDAQSNGFFRFFFKEKNTFERSD